MSRQSCVICAWRENCNKRFCVPDGGSRCPDFSRDITIKPIEEQTPQIEKDKDKPVK
ncbi:MAG TPA: hypothetical protein PLN25_08255 [Deltaproteobacteria bacterium]|nr:hypothetical protein [Deltaproteobacteria bacterium]HQB38467.1 hypothetical protein [Deltaproteobacteria bacterium]